MRRLLAALVGAVVVAMVAPPPARAVGPPIVFTEAQVRGLLFGTAIRAYDPNLLPDGTLGYDKHLVMSAELLDWRAAHPQAGQAELTAHAAGVEQALEVGFGDYDLSRTKEGIQARLLEIVFAAPGAALGGPHLGVLLAAVVGRDHPPYPLTIDQRLNVDAQRRLAATGYDDAPVAVWGAVVEAVSVDVAFQGAFHTAVAVPAGVADPGTAVPVTWSLADLKGLAKVSALVDVTALTDAAATGVTAFLTEFDKAMAALQKRLAEENEKNSTKAGNLNNDTSTNPAPGSSGPPVTPSALKQALTEEAAAQKEIDAVKSAFDFVTGLLATWDPEVAKEMKKVTTAAYKIATGINRLVTGIKTLLVAGASSASGIGAIVGIVGAGIGIGQVIAGLFGDSAKQQQQEMLKEMKAEFAQVRQMLGTIYEQMHKRFDRIDAALNTIYADMLRGFDRVLDVLNGVTGSIQQLRGELAALDTKLHGALVQILKSDQTATTVDYITKADRYVDYAHENGSPIPSFDTTSNNYVDAVSTMTTAGTSLAKKAPFIWTGPSGSDPNLVLDSVGAAGAVNYLAGYAASHYGVGISVPADVANGDLLAQSARAYALIALQNTGFGRQETATRLDVIRAVAEQTIAAQRQFSVPNAAGPTSTNALFAAVLAENAQQTAAFGNELAALEQDPVVMAPDRKFALFGPVSQPVPDAALPTTGLAGTIFACTGSGSMPRPSFVNGTRISAPLRFGRFLDRGATWTHSACFTEMPSQTVETEHCVTVWVWEIDPDTGQRHRVPEEQCTTTTSELFIAAFRETITVPGYGPILGGITVGQYRVCVDNGPCTQAGGPIGAPTVDPNAGVEPAAREQMKKQGLYYALVAQKLDNDAFASRRQLDTNVRVLRAYTELGLPAAVETDDQLRALLYGAVSLPSDLDDSRVLAAAYRMAGENVLAGKDMWTGQLLERPVVNGVACDNLTTVVTGTDPITRCMVVTGAERRKRLTSRYEVHFKGIRDGLQLQENPTIRDTVGALGLVSRQVHAMA